MATLTTAEWLDLIEFYHEGHTMLECAAIYGVSNATICRYFKKNGIKARKILEPSRPEKAARVVTYKAPRGNPRGVPRPPPVRKIIQRTDNESPRYEKEI